MTLSKAALLALRGMDESAKKRIADASGVAVSSLYRWIRTNDDNLTKAATIAAIKEETGLDDAQILEDVTPEQATAARG